MLQTLKEEKNTKYFIGCKSKVVHNFQLVPLYTGFLHNTKTFGFKIVIQFNMSI